MIFDRPAKERCAGRNKSSLDQELIVEQENRGIFCSSLAGTTRRGDAARGILHLKLLLSVKYVRQYWSLKFDRVILQVG